MGTTQSKRARKQLRKDAARRETLRRTFDHYLARSDETLAQAYCPQNGLVGRELIDQLKKTGCGEKLDDHEKEWGNAFFSSYHRPLSKNDWSFMNRILYGPALFNDFSFFMLVRCHEAIHAIQHTKAPILHAMPYHDKMTNVILTPKDYLKVCEAMEIDAYVKTAWLAHLLGPHDLFVEQTSKKFAFNAQDIANHIEKTPSLADAFNQATDNVFVKNGVSTTLRNQYHTHFLKLYCQILVSCQARGITPLLCRTEESDIKEIGTAFGPSLFDQSPVSLDNAILSDENQARLNALNEQLGITHQTKIPTFSEALANSKISRTEHMKLGCG